MGNALDRMIRVYDRTMVGGHQQRYYGHSGFYNFGYWGAGAQSQREASEALVDQLIARIPAKTGRILDVACGLGGSTARLMQSYPPDMITGINVSEVQLAQARMRAPGCTFLHMSATRLEFPDSHFDAVMCVEAAFHFDTRDAFLREAFRVLKPGGTLVLSDMLFRGFVNLYATKVQLPAPNLVSDIATYKARLTQAGFDAIDIQDATKACMGGFHRHIAHWPAAEYKAGRMPLGRRLAASVVCRMIGAYFEGATKAYLLVSARKPPASDRA